MDYYEIGQRIRKYRKAYGLSQEQLADKIGISTTHMSHIETGNTKLSLPVLVSLSETLNVHTDDLLFENRISKSEIEQSIHEILNSCTPKQALIIQDTLQNLKISLDKYL